MSLRERKTSYWLIQSETDPTLKGSTCEKEFKCGNILKIVALQIRFLRDRSTSRRKWFGKVWYMRESPRVTGLF